MKKNNIIYFLVLLILAVSRLPAQNATDVTQAYDAKELLSKIAMKHEILGKGESAPKDIELCELYLQYFQTEESLSFDKNKFAGGKYRERLNYIISDDGVIRAFSWEDRNERSPEAGSIVQFRNSFGSLRTALITQSGKEGVLPYNLYLVSYFILKIYILKENIYLLKGSTSEKGIEFLTLEFKEDTVIPYFAFKDNHMSMKTSISVFDPKYHLDNLPFSLDIQIISQPDLFAIELDILFPKNPENMYKWVSDYIVEEKDTFKHKEKFLFDGKEFVGNYWVLSRYWDKGERPENISQFFPKTEFDEQDDTVSVEAEDADNIEKEKSAKTRMGFKIILILIASIAVVGGGVVFVVKRK